MDIKTYLSLVEDYKGKQCTIYLEDGQIEEGVFMGESNVDKLGMVIKMTGETRKKYEHIGISDPNPRGHNLETLDIRDNKISILISAIKSIEFKD